MYGVCHSNGLALRVRAGDRHQTPGIILLKLGIWIWFWVKHIVIIPLLIKPTLYKKRETMFPCSARYIVYGYLDEVYECARDYSLGSPLRSS